MKKSFIHQQEEISFVKNTFTQYLKDKLGLLKFRSYLEQGRGWDAGQPVQVSKIQYPSRFAVR